VTPGRDRFLGIDFSGNAAMWRPGCGRSNVWIATVEAGVRARRLVALHPVQALPGPAHPFERLAALLAAGRFAAAGIDAPLCIPARHLPPGGRAALVEELAALPCADRPFPRGAALLALATRDRPLAEPKPRRAAERVWSGRGLNIRSTLWAGQRPGTPFTAAALALVARAQAPCWPWAAPSPGLIVESFPMAQLKTWGLPHLRYDGAEGAAVRARILAGLDRRIALPAPLTAQMQASADALDAVLAAFGAIAVLRGRLAAPLPEDHGDEGWIAVHA